MKNALLMAFEVTAEDVQNVCRMFRQPVDEITDDNFFGTLDLKKVTQEALDGGTEMEDQTASAYEEIARQLKAQNFIKPDERAVCARCGHTGEDHNGEGSSRCWHGSGNGNTCACLAFEEPK